MFEENKLNLWEPVWTVHTFNTEKNCQPERPHWKAEFRTEFTEGLK